MIRGGILTDEDRVELLDGYLVRKKPKSPKHAKVVRRLRVILEAMLPPGLTPIKEDPVTFPGSEPEPDITVVSGDSLNRVNSHPTAADCRLIIEVAETTLGKDRGRAAVSAAAGVPVYWIANLVTGQFECYSDLHEGRYRQTSSSETVELVFDGVTCGRVSLDDVLG